MAVSFAQVEQYLGGLTITQGPLAGQPLQLMPWQRRFLRAALGKGVSTAALSVARGNGKTALLAALAAAHVAGPLAQPRAEVVLIASSFEQARLAYDHALAYLDVYDDEGAVRDEWRVSNSSNRCEAVYRPTGVKVKARGADPRRAHGLAPSLILADEPAQWAERTSETMVAALVTALGKIEGARMIALGTRAADPDHWFERWLRGGADMALSYQAGEDDPPYLRRTVRKANPSLDHMPQLSQAIDADARRARQDASALASYRALRLNQGVADTAYALVLDASTWQTCETDDPPPMQGLCVWGVDLGATAAMSALASYWPETGRLEVMAAYPGDGEMTLAARGIRDGVGTAYLDMQRRGELILTSGRTVDVGELVSEGLSRYGPPDVVASDRWREGELLDAMELVGVPPGLWVPRGMGFKDGSDDVRRFRRRAIDGQVRTPVSHLMRRAMAGARVQSDPAGNAKISKLARAAARCIATMPSWPPCTLSPRATGRPHRWPRAAPPAPAGG